MLAEAQWAKQSTAMEHCECLQPLQLSAVAMEHCECLQSGPLGQAADLRQSWGVGLARAGSETAARNGDQGRCRETAIGAELSTGTDPVVVGSRAGTKHLTQ